MAETWITRTDLGWSYAPAKDLAVAMPTLGTYPFPGDSLIRAKIHKRGLFGFPEAHNEQFASYEDQIVAAIAPLIRDNTFIVLPEFAGSPRIEQEVTRLLASSGARCIVICGSYYHQDDHDRIDSRSPIVFPDRAPLYQFKLDPAPKLEANFGCSPATHREIRVFANTGFGDFAVLICSDGLSNHLTPEIVKPLRCHIDALFVIARNHSDEIPAHLMAISRNERWLVAYCNGASNTSRVFAPFRHQLPIENSLGGLTHFSLTELSEAMAAERDLADTSQSTLATCDPDGGFRPRPRNCADSKRGVLAFARHQKVLAIGSHFDDVWLGASATLMLLNEVHAAQVACTSLCGNYPYPYFGKHSLRGREEELDGLMADLSLALGFSWHSTTNAELIDRDLAGRPDRLKKAVTGLRDLYYDADLVMVPRHDDYHEDHRAVATLVCALFQGATIFEYEVKPFRRSPFRPSIAVDVGLVSNADLTFRGEQVFQGGNGSFAQKKAALLSSCFSAVLRGDVPPLFSREQTLGRMSMRASECSRDAQYAEGFVTEVVV